jgi:hypothetical protein
MATTRMETEAFRKRVVAPVLEEMERKGLGFGVMFWEQMEKVQNATTGR